MKLINNQETRLCDEVKSYLTESSELFISASYFSINAVYELISQLQQVKNINILIDGDYQLDIRFAYDEKEWVRYLDLTNKYKAEKVFKIIEDKCNIRQGNTGGQKFILIKNTSGTHCFSITPHDLNLISLGMLPSAGPIISNARHRTWKKYGK